MDLSTRQMLPNNASFPSPDELQSPQDLSHMADYKNMSSLDFDKYVYSLNWTTTGCYRQGAIPMALAPNDSVLLGFYSPATSDGYPPQFCPPTEACQTIRANRGTCNVQGQFEPKICSNGHYCPEGGKQQIPCEPGYYCPQGSYKPIKCDTGAICGSQSARQITLVPLYLVIIIDVALAIAVLCGFVISKWRKRTKPQYSSLGDNKDEFDDMEMLRAPSQSPRLSVSSYDDETHDDPHNPDMERFLRSLARAVETKEVGLSFDFENLGCKVKGKKTILAGVTGSIPRGTMWGIMGGSGAGKSTFVNLLMGKTKHTSGTVKINGWEKDMSQYKKLVGYVPQDDIVLPELTVRENILHSARMRLPSTWKDREIQAHVDALVACLALSHVQHSLVGDARKPVISGGQRKRVSIGIELAAAPMAIFLDEPTSGLDATSAASIMRLLKSITRLGVTTISIIHQPREQIFSAFDSLLLLGSGRQIYGGPAVDAQSYFESLGFEFPMRGNPADTIMDIITGDGFQYTMKAERQASEVQHLISFWQDKGQYGRMGKHLSVDTHELAARRSRRSSNQSMQSTQEQEDALRRTMKVRGATWIAQVYYCCKRAITQQVRNGTSFFFEIGVGGLAGLIIGLSAFSAAGHNFQGIFYPPYTLLSSAVDYQSVPQIGLLSAMAIGLAASAPGVRVFGEEKLIFWREAASGHSRSAYYCGKVLSTLGRIALSSLHFTVFMGILATPLMSFTDMYVANLGYFYAVYGFSSVISMLVKREDGPLLAVLLSLIIGILGGVAPPLSKVKSWGLEWLWRMSPGVWFTEAYFSQNLLPLKHLYVLELASKVVGFTLGQYGKDVAMLFFIGTVYRVIAYLGLVLINRRRQK